jgi:hypothetical protein
LKAIQKMALRVRWELASAPPVNSNLNALTFLTCPWTIGVLPDASVESPSAYMGSSVRPPMEGPPSCIAGKLAHLALEYLCGSGVHGLAHGAIIHPQREHFELWKRETSEDDDG